MKSYSLFIILIGLICNPVFAQIKNQKTVTVAVNGNCGMCKKTIEKAGNEKNVSNVVWDQDKKQAIINFDAEQTNLSAVLKKIALAGYDNQEFRAADKTYASLHECCQYDRDHEITAHGPSAGHQDSPNLNQNSQQKSEGLNPVFQQYLKLKDALVATDGKSAALQAKNLVTNIQAVDMKSLAEKEHMAWMKVYKGLAAEANKIAKESNVEKQRKAFHALSNQIIPLAKEAKLSMNLYLQHCPMANDNQGADWLSAENIVKNPYYGSKMMNCGEVKEKI